MTSSPRVLRGLGAALVAAAVLVPAPAVAHDGLIASTPADGAVLEAPPEEVRLEFSGEVDAELSAIAVQLADDQQARLLGPALRDGRTLLQGLDGGGAVGVWTVNWRAVSSDGHPVEGAYSFTVAEGAAPEPQPEVVEPESEAVPATPVPAPPALPVAARGPVGGGGLWVPLAGSAALALALYGAVRYRGRA